MNWEEIKRFGPPGVMFIPDVIPPHTEFEKAKAREIAIKLGWIKEDKN